MEYVHLSTISPFTHSSTDYEVLEQERPSSTTNTKRCLPQPPKNLLITTLECKYRSALVVVCCVLRFLRLRNPLSGIPKDTLLRDVESYASTHGLEEYLDLLKKGALVAQNPDGAQTIEGMTPDELQQLQNETTSRWNHPWTLYLVIALNSVGASIQGWDQTGSNGANLSFPQEFGIADSGALCESLGTCEANSWIVGAINAAPYMALCVL